MCLYRQHETVSAVHPNHQMLMQEIFSPCLAVPDVNITRS